MAKLNDYPSHVRNPSVYESNKKKLDGMGFGKLVLDGEFESWVDLDTGDVQKRMQKLADGSKKLVDGKHFLKVYEESFERISKLGNSAIKVLMYIWKDLSKDCDCVVVDVDDCVKKMWLRKSKQRLYRHIGFARE